MQKYVYLSLVPESLIASMLPPKEFGSYFAVGTKKRSRGQALFFEVDREKASDNFPWDEMERHCVPQKDGRRKRSVYLSVYRTLEHVPLDALKGLYLATDDGRVLPLEPKPYEPGDPQQFHLYQELCPVTPRVVSRLNPPDFCKSITDRTKSVSVDKIVFCELTLGGLAQNADSNDIDDLPYQNIEHLRDCIHELEKKPSKATKVVVRAMSHEVLFRTIRSGFFVGDQNKMLYYPMPSHDEMERKYHDWWRSALTTFGE